MGKSEEQSLHQQQSNDDEAENRDSSGLLCQGCSMVLSRIAQDFSLRCVVVLLLILSMFVSGIFWILPYRPTLSGFDAEQAIKLIGVDCAFPIGCNFLEEWLCHSFITYFSSEAVFIAPVQAYFVLEKPVSHLVPCIGRLEYDITVEIGVPDMKVSVLSMHQLGGSNWTTVVFGALPDPINTQISPVSLSVLRSSLIEVFLQTTNLTLTTSTFGQPSGFEILKFQGGITVIPVQPAPIWQIPQILFNFTLSNSISDILDYIVELKDQLKYGLQLGPYETVFVQITNTFGSTTAPPVIIQASVVLPDYKSLQPQRLKQLALTLTGSRARNLGLNNSVFGKVKSISLSSYLKGTLSPISPSPSPAPAPGPSDYAGPAISPDPAPTYSPAPSPGILDPSPCYDCDASAPTPSIVALQSPQPCPYHRSAIPPSYSPTSPSNPIVPSAYTPTAAPPNSRPMGPKSRLSPGVSPVPQVSVASSPGESKGNTKSLMSPSIAPSPSSLAAVPLYNEIWSLGLSTLIGSYVGEIRRQNAGQSQKVAGLSSCFDIFLGHKKNSGYLSSQLEDLELCRFFLSLCNAGKVSPKKREEFLYCLFILFELMKFPGSNPQMVCTKECKSRSRKTLIRPKSRSGNEGKGGKGWILNCAGKLVREWFEQGGGAAGIPRLQVGVTMASVGQNTFLN
ncbi:hypothetical protein TIFTF001_027999 [Ficus carica]|uniref:DUF7036 domain-containing protein n=1 Tax=Ficus carica TaxID=3494 RepID=A0AA88DP44_FICCA|nr:hypothetical protein TIFTF001_027999 [Ficus carica]